MVPDIAWDLDVIIDSHLTMVDKLLSGQIVGQFIWSSVVKVKGRFINC